MIHDLSFDTIRKINTKIMSAGEKLGFPAIVPSAERESRKILLDIYTDLFFAIV